MNRVVEVYSSNITSKVILGVVGFILVRFIGESEFADYTIAFSIIVFVSQPIVDITNR